MDSSATIRLGIIGVGGFAGRHHQTALDLEGEGHCRLVAACDPSAAALAEAGKQWRFGARGVRGFDDYRAMLDACRQELDLVVIPTPIPLHAEMHQACVERGLAVYLEKPPTLDPEELEEMIAVDAAAAHRTTVGFHLVVDEARRQLKRRLLAGEFGKLREVVFRGFAPRAVSYFQRAPWAARLRIDGKRVLDSCFGNAMAHYVHNVLLWSGSDGVESPAGLARVTAEIYRAHAIEGADTFFVSAETTAGIRLRIGMTHACAGITRQEEQVLCEEATLHYRTGRECRIEWKDGREETVEVPAAGTLLRQSHLCCYDYLQGRRSRAVTLLEECRSFVHLNALAYVSAGKIVPVPEEGLERSTAQGPEGEANFIAIREIAPIIDRFADRGIFPSEAGIAWARPSDGSAAPEDLARVAALGF